jgi:hypothetical protein
VDFVTQLERTVIDNDQERRVRMGQRIDVHGSFNAPEIAALNHDGELVAILRPRDEKWKPQVVLPSTRASSAD